MEDKKSIVITGFNELGIMEFNVFVRGRKGYGCAFRHAADNTYCVLINYFGEVLEYDGTFCDFDSFVREFLAKDLF